MPRQALQTSSNFEVSFNFNKHARWLEIRQNDRKRTKISLPEVDQLFIALPCTTPKYVALHV